MRAVPDLPGTPSAAAAVERLLARVMPLVPAPFRVTVATFARNKLAAPPSTFAQRLREHGLDAGPADAADMWAAMLWALSDE